MKGKLLALLLVILCAGRPAHAQPTDAVYQLPGKLHISRSVHSATLLPDGTVLIAGGMTNGEQFLDSAEIFDPSTNTFYPTGSLTVPRSTHAAILLHTGKVLVMGGYGQGRLSSTDLYDPATRTFSPAGTMNAPREGFTATLLTTGQLLIAGGYGSTYRESLDSAEVYDPLSWTLNIKQHKPTSR